MRRPVTVPLKHRQRSVPVESDYGITFQWEKFPKLTRELLPLLKRHYKEITYLDIDLDLDWDLYHEYNSRGILHILTARQDGDLVGYIFNLVGPHLHHVSTKWAAATMYWMDPRTRLGWWPVKMFLENLRGMQEREVNVHSVSITLKFQSGRVGKIFQRLGYTPNEILFTKVLK